MDFQIYLSSLGLEAGCFISLSSRGLGAAGRGLGEPSQPPPAHDEWLANPAKNPARVTKIKLILVSYSSMIDGSDTACRLTVSIVSFSFDWF